MQMTAVLTAAAEGGYIASNPETGTTTQGETVESALANLKEATELYFEVVTTPVFGNSFITTFEVSEHA